MVIEPDMKYPTHAGLAAQGVNSLARESCKLARFSARYSGPADLISDPDPRPIRKGKLGKPTELGYVAQVAAVSILRRTSTVDGRR